MRAALRLALFAVALLLLGRSIAWGTSYYVDPNGDDGNPGTPEAPWRTIQHAADTVVPGDIVLVQPGLYRESVVITRSGAPGSPITFQGTSGAILESPDPALSFSAFDVRGGTQYVVLDGFELRGGYHETIYVRTGAAHVVIRNCNIFGNRVGIWVQSAMDVEIAGCYVHANIARGVRITGSSVGVVLQDTESSNNDDGWGCFGDADGFTVEETVADVEFRNCVANENSEDGFDIQGDDVRVLRAEVRNNGCAGIKMAQNGRIENAIVAGNSLGISTATYYNAPTQVEIYNSIVVNNSGQQLYLRQPTTSPPANYGVVVRNVIAAGAGKAIEAGSAVVLTEDHNVLFREDTTNPLIVQYLAAGGSRKFSGQDINAGLWTAASGQGVGTWAIAPGFADPNTYYPAADDVAVDSGEATGAPLEDIDGSPRPQGLRLDIGAFESPVSLANHRPWADPGANRTKVVGHRVDFSAYGSVDPDGDPISYSWDFGDGSSPESGYAVSHTYRVAGLYTVTLTVSDGSLSRSRTTVVDVVPEPTLAPTPTQTPTSTETPTGTLLPSWTPTLTTTPTYTRTAEPTPTPILDSSCGDMPRLGCRRALATKLTLGRSLTNPGVRGLRWKWVKGDATSLSDFGDPSGGSTQYALCLFSESAGGARLLMSVDVPSGGSCRGKPCWTAIAQSGFDYKDGDMLADGVARLSLRAGGEGRAKVTVIGKGPNLPLPLLPLDPEAVTTVQLVNSEGECWESVYPAPPAVNRENQFKAYRRD